MEKQFVTNDIWLASFIAYHGLNPELEIEGGRVVFRFKDAKAYELTNSYFSGAEVPCSAYAEVHKSLKVKMFSARGAR